MYQLLRPIHWRGTCPGGTYLDEFKKEQKCPKEGQNFIFTKLSPIARKAMKNFSGGNIPILEFNCPRCGSSFKLYPEPSNDSPLIYDVTTVNYTP